MNNVGDRVQTDDGSIAGELIATWRKFGVVGRDDSELPLPVELDKLVSEKTVALVLRESDVRLIANREAMPATVFDRIYAAAKRLFPVEP